uniref:Uncharacterized protein n=1 Tax=Arundo donax TaxID=35708 RepID=A0A0A9BC06_ARUDO
MEPKQNILNTPVKLRLAKTLYLEGC